MMILLLCVFSVLYIVFTFCLWYCWRSIVVFTPLPDFQVTDKVSVIIPMRNEAQNIKALLEDLDRQSWPGEIAFQAEQLEVIVINDRSEDGSDDIVRAFRPDRFKLLLLQSGLAEGFEGSHKKAAIEQAVTAARGNIVLTTDGDCRVGQYWIASLLQFMKLKKAVMVSAPVTFFGGQTFFEKLQHIEFASLIGTGAASLQVNRPTMCNGANLAYRKSAFIEVKGYIDSMHIPSGDDEFLLQKVHQKFPGQIFFLKAKEAVVRTPAQASLRGFYHQRKRWAGKWKLHKRIGTALLAVFIFAFHALLIGTAVLSLIGDFPWQLFLGILLLKGVAEYVFLRSVLRSMGERLITSNFLVLQLIYSLYAVFFGIVANFGSYQWKERQYT